MKRKIFCAVLCVAMLSAALKADPVPAFGYADAFTVRSEKTDSQEGTGSQEKTDSQQVAGGQENTANQGTAGSQENTDSQEGTGSQEKTDSQQAAGASEKEANQGTADGQEADGSQDKADSQEGIGSQAKNGLLKENGYYRYYEDGELVTSRWVTVGKDTYYFGSNGKASVLSCKIGKKYYVFDSNGKLQQPSSAKMVSVKTSKGETKKYCVNPDGTAVSGWSGDKKYYCSETGEPLTGIQVIKEKFYCFNANGKYNASKTQKLRKAAKYEKPFSEVKKYIGNPKKTKYYASCYGKGKDGILTYDSFKVYTFKPDNGIEIFMGAE